MNDNRLALDKSNIFRYMSSEDMDYSKIEAATISFKTAWEIEQERLKNKGVVAER